MQLTYGFCLAEKFMKNSSYQRVPDKDIIIVQLEGQTQHRTKIILLGQIEMGGWFYSTYTFIQQVEFINEFKFHEQHYKCCLVFKSQMSIFEKKIGGNQCRQHSGLQKTQLKVVVRYTQLVISADPLGLWNISYPLKKRVPLYSLVDG